MGNRIREIEAERKFSRELTVQAIERAVPMDDIRAVLHEHDAEETRERKLNMAVVVLLTITMNLYIHLSLKHVMRKIAQGFRFTLLGTGTDISLPKDSAISYRRYQLGARPLVALFHRVCRPMATPQTQGAYLFGLRLVAIDGTVEDVPDTPENAAYFGRHHSDRGDSAFPQVQCVYLCECGTHGIIDAGFWPLHVSERVGGFRMLRSVQPDMLVMWDRGFHDYDMIMAVRERGGHILGRLPSHVKPKYLYPLADGSYLAYLYPSDYQRRKRGEHLLVRIVEYTFTDPALPHYGEVHRLVTTLLDAKACPALELVCAYHERWEVELVVDEIDTHQRLTSRTLRSQKPVGVIQELYAMLIAHYTVRHLMYESAVRAEVDPDRLSFVHALRVIQDAIPEFEMAPPNRREQLYERLLGDIAEELLPERRHRINPRVVKRKMSKFHLKRPPHYHWPQPTHPFREAVAII